MNDDDCIGILRLNGWFGLNEEARLRLHGETYFLTNPGLYAPVVLESRRQILLTGGKKWPFSKRRFYLNGTEYIYSWRAFGRGHYLKHQGEVIGEVTVRGERRWTSASGVFPEIFDYPEQVFFLWFSLCTFRRGGSTTP